MSVPPASPPELPLLVERELRAEIERKSAELEKSLAMMSGVLEAVAEAILVVDTSGAITNHNRGFVEMWRLPEAMASDMANVTDVMLRKYTVELVAKPEEFVARLDRIRTDPSAVTTDEIELLDGRVLSRYTSPVRTTSGEVRGRVWCFRDVTEARNLAARRAVVQERMASVGQLVSSVAHEINNPLAYIAGNVGVVIDSLTSGPPMRSTEVVEALEDVNTGVERIKIIIRDLRTLSRMDDETREPMDVRAVLETALQMANNELRHRALVVRNLQPVPLVSVNSVRMTQVFLNLLLNAAHAIPDGRASENTVTVSTSKSPLGGACIEIRDTGAGIEPGHLERIFDPFFTTKPVGTGRGLGLTICKGIIEKLGGSIEVESRPGVGSTFTVELPPSTPAPVHPSRTSATPVAPQRRRRSILVIDDDAQIRRWFQRILSHHDLTTVSSVAAAEEAIKTGSFDVILCDVMMPDRTGMDMHATLSSRRPDLLPRLVFMSGGAFTPALSNFIENVANRCLKKPFGREELERTIERIAEGH